MGASDVTCDVMFPFLLATVKPHSNQDGVCVHLCVCVCVCVCVCGCVYGQGSDGPIRTKSLESTVHIRTEVPLYRQLLAV